MQQRIQRFEVIEQLGAGGMGAVYRARDPELDRNVAIKMVAVARPPSELSARDTMDLRNDATPPRDELLREARIMARLSHPNVLPVYEVGLCDGAVFLVMEHIAGMDLAAWLAVPRPTEEILGVFLQAAHGLAAAHACSIVHRDIKPGNILIGRDGRVRVADFGLSRLTARPTTEMVYIDDGRGTPRYMAPELWRGSAATVASDVYAFCLTLVEALLEHRASPSDASGGYHGAEDGRADHHAQDRALRERQVAPQLRALLARGVAEDPAIRPTLGELIAALGGNRPRGRPWLVAGGAVTAAAVIVAIGAGAMLPASREGIAAGPPVVVCDRDPAALAGKWRAAQDPARQLARPDALARMLVDKAEPEQRAFADRIAGDLDERKRAIDRHDGAACEALRAHTITADQYRVRASCLQRRRFEVTATIDLLLDREPTLLEARDRYHATSEPSVCTEIAAPPITADPAAVELLWRRYIRAGLSLSQNIDELTAVATAAAEAGETELMTRAIRWRGGAYRNTGDLPRADQDLQQAYRRAQELHATHLVIQTLLDLSQIARLRANDTAAFSYAELALTVADRDSIPSTIRARAHQVFGHALSARDDEGEAIRHLRTALDLLRAQGGGGILELGTRSTLVWTLTQQAVQEPATIELANEYVELARGQAGPSSSTLGNALNALAEALAATGDYARAIPYRRRAIELLTAYLTTTWREDLPQIRTSLAADLRGTGLLHEAQHEIDELQKLPAKYVQHRWLSEGFFALVAFELGKHDDGLSRASHALEEAISEYGKSHHFVFDLRSWVIGMQLEMGQLDAAAHNIAALDGVYSAVPDRHRLRLHRLRATLGAELAIARGKPAEAMEAARQALDAAPELRATDRDRADFLASLGRGLAAERRWSQARGPLVSALALLQRLPVRPDDVAAVEVELARVEQGLGERAVARARARRARTILAGYPGKVRARAQANALVTALR